MSEENEKAGLAEAAAKFKGAWTVIRVIEGLAFITLGVLAIVYCQNDEFQAWIYRIFGIVLGIDGIISLLRYFFEPVTIGAVVSEFLTSVLEISFGILFAVKAPELLGNIKSLILFFIATLCFVIAFTIAMGATFAIVRRRRSVVIGSIEYVLSLLFVAGGVLLLVYQEKADSVVYTVVMVLIGLLMAGIGIFDLVSVFAPYRKERVKKAKVEKVKPEKKSNVVDAEVKPREEKETGSSEDSNVVDAEVKKIEEKK